MATELDPFVRQVLAALADPLAAELARVDDAAGRQIVLHVQPYARGVRIQMPPKIMTIDRQVGAPGALT